MRTSKPNWTKIWTDIADTLAVRTMIGATFIANLRQRSAHGPPLPEAIPDLRHTAARVAAPAGHG